MPPFLSLYNTKPNGNISYLQAMILWDEKKELLWNTLIQIKQINKQTKNNHAEETQKHINGRRGKGEGKEEGKGEEKEKERKNEREKERKTHKLSQQ